MELDGRLMSHNATPGESVRRGMLAVLCGYLRLRKVQVMVHHFKRRMTGYLFRRSYFPTIHYVVHIKHVPAQVTIAYVKWR